jgi:hypothetical protein
MACASIFLSLIRTARHAMLPRGDAACLELLGLDDATLAGWDGARTVLVTLPHASPNVFHPRTRVAWAAGHVQRIDAGTHHLRLVLTHTNFSDMGWRPYCWWYLDGAQRVRELRLFSRNKKRKHAVVRSQPPMREDAPDLLPVDSQAAHHAAAGANLAVSAMLVMASVERAAGMSLPGRTTYLPLEVLIDLARALALEPGDAPAHRWCRALMGVAGRRVDESGNLVDCAGVRAEVFDNLNNLAALSLLADPSVTGAELIVAGGAKMAGYWPDVVAVRRSRDGGDALPDPRLLLVPEVDASRLPAPGPGVAAQLSAMGIEYSQGMSVTQHGDFAARTDPFDVPALWRKVSGFA